MPVLSVIFIFIFFKAYLYSSHGEICRTGGPTGQKLIRSDENRLFSRPKDQQWSANVFVDTTAQAVLICESKVSNTI